MSQAGIVDFEASHPQVPTMFVTDSGTAIPIANTIEILATTVAAHNIPIETTGSGNVVTVVAQYSSSSATSIAAKAGFASFDSSIFTVDANGFVTIGGTIYAKTITGNDGIPEAPVAGNWNIVTANATAKFAGTSGTETLNFGIGNLVLGSSLPSLSSGTLNVGLGFQVLNALTSGQSNTAIGYISSTAMTSGLRNTSVGAGSLQTNTTSVDSTAIGYQALNANNGNSCTAVGSQALLKCTNGFNTAVGATALSQLTSNGSSCAMGYASLSQATGAGNCGFGYNSGTIVTSGQYNTFMGTSAGNQLLTGSYNTLLGSADSLGVGANYTGSESNNILVGSTGTTGDNNVIRIGQSGSSTGQQNKCFIAGIDGVNVGSVAKVVTETGDQLGTATITAGTGISVVATANTITINAVGEGMTWSVVTAASQAMSVNHGYIANNAGTVAFTLPTTSAVGDTITVTGMNNATGWSIGYTTNQQIFFGTSSATITSGSLASTATRDTVTLVCIVANLTWNVVSSIGNITVA